MTAVLDVVICCRGHHAENLQVDLEDEKEANCGELS